MFYKLIHYGSRAVRECEKRDSTTSDLKVVAGSNNTIRHRACIYYYKSLTKIKWNTMQGWTSFAGETLYNYRKGGGLEKAEQQPHRGGGGFWNPLNILLIKNGGVRNHNSVKS